MGDGWFAELKQRRVFRALLGYGVVAFGVLVHSTNAYPKRLVKVHY